MGEMTNAYKVKSINLNGRDLCMAGSKILNYIFKKRGQKDAVLS
jgi:hypothetical protein